MPDERIRFPGGANARRCIHGRAIPSLPGDRWCIDCGSLASTEGQPIAVGDIVQVEPHAVSVFAGCCGFVEALGVYLEIRVSRPSRSPATRSTRALVRIGRAAWTDP